MCAEASTSYRVPIVTADAEAAWEGEVVRRQRDHVDLPGVQAWARPERERSRHDDGWPGLRGSAGLRRLGRAVRGGGLSGVPGLASRPAGAFVSRRQTYPRPRQDASARRRPALPPAPAGRIVVAVVLGARGSVGTDALAPYEIFARTPAFFVYTVAAGRATSVLSGGLVLAPQHSLEDTDADKATARSTAKTLEYPAAHLQLAGSPWPLRPTALLALTIAAAIGVTLLPAAAWRHRP